MKTEQSVLIYQHKGITMKKLLRVKQVAEVTGLGVSTIWEYAKDGKFPKPHKLSTRVTVWKHEDVDAWIDSKVS